MNLPRMVPVSVAYDKSKHNALGLINRLNSTVRVNTFGKLSLSDFPCPPNSPLFSFALVLLMDYPHKCFVRLMEDAKEFDLPVFICRSLSNIYQVVPDEEYLGEIPTGLNWFNTNPQTLVEDLSNFFGIKYREDRIQLARKKKYPGQIELF